MSDTTGSFNGSEIAVVSMACRFPGASDLDAFWRNLRDGVESISFFSDEELLQAGLSPEALADPRLVKAGGILDGIEDFDADFFGFLPSEAEVTDIQFRLFLECVWEALEGGSVAPDSFSGLIGVFAGAGMNTYMLPYLPLDPQRADREGLLHARVFNGSDFLPAQTCYRLDLRGPSVNVQSGCSTSLVAVHLACQSLLSGECDAALAGAATVIVPQVRGYLYEEKMVHSPDGHCRAFDDQAAGTVGSNGAGAVLLQRLEDALEQGRPVLAVIKGSAINNDGALKAGFTSPSREGQAAVISEALAVAQVDPATISYVEAHGTGTEIGDVIEVEALSEAFQAAGESARPGAEGEGTDRSSCALGSVKSNLGHLDTAAGVAGLIKTVLALRHRQIPPSLHFEKPNPRIDFANGPFVVNDQLRPWTSQPGQPRRAGVSSFGMGGANAHVVLEEAPLAQAGHPSSRWQLLTLSAKSEAALETATDRLAEHFRSRPDLNLADVAYTLQTGRKAFDFRRIAVCRESEEPARLLASRDPERIFEGRRQGPGRSLAFMFPGVGDQHPGMAAELYREEPGFRQPFEECCRLFEPLVGEDLAGVIHPQGAKPKATDQLDFRSMVSGRREDPSGASARLNQTLFAHTSIFAVEYALARLWMSWGVIPDALIGHSVGEFAACCIAGVLPLSDAVRLVAERARLIQGLEEGAMTAAPLPEDELGPLLGEALSIAAVNTPSMCVASGPVEAIADLERRLEERGHVSRRVSSSHAFHSGMMLPVREPLQRLAASFDLRPPRIPCISSVTGTWLTEEQARDAEYWAQHSCSTVRFADGVAQLMAAPGRILLETGPGRSLGGFALQHPDCSADQDLSVFSSLPHADDPVPEAAFMLTTLGKLWSTGLPIDWQAFGQDEQRSDQRRCYATLPSYPFQRRRHWREPPRQAAAEHLEPTVATSFQEAAVEPLRSPIEDCFYLPSWRRSVPPAAVDDGDSEGEAHWLLFMDSQGLGREIVRQLQQRGAEVTTVSAGAGFVRSSRDEFRLDPDRKEDYTALLDELREQGRLPQRVLHLWNVDGQPQEAGDGLGTECAQASYFRLLYLIQSLGELGFGSSLSLAAVSVGMWAVSGEEKVQPEKALAVGPIRTLPSEAAGVRAACIDLQPDPLDGDWQGAAQRVLAEVQAGLPQSVVAWRGRFRWVEEIVPARLEALGETDPLRSEGVYLIAGGLGGVGLAIAEAMARRKRLRLALVSRRGLPPRARWESLLADQDPEFDPTPIRRVLALEQSGSEILIVSADISHPQQAKEAVDSVRLRFGGINGIVQAAGVPGVGLMQFKTRESAEAVLRPKVEGTLHLLEAVGEADLDFLAICSSLGSLFSEIGQSDYCAANSFLDALAQRRFLDGRRTVSIGWGLWRWDAWQHAMSRFPKMRNRISDWRQRYGLTDEEGGEAFLRLLSCPMPQVIVSTYDPQPYTHGQGESLLESLMDESGADDSRSRQGLSAEIAAPTNDYEQTILDIWKELFGFDEIGIQDHFMDLGGHSILAIQLASRLREAFQVEIPMSTVFSMPTVAKLALVVEEALLDEIEQLTIDESEVLVEFEE